MPLLGSILFQQLYNIADSLVAGKFIGENALAAVGNSYEITLIFIAFAFGSNIGCSVVTSRLFGARDNDRLKTAVSTAFVASGALCLLLMLFGFTLSPALLGAIDTPKSIFVDCRIYLNIYIGGLLFLFFYNISTGIFSAMGDSRTPFIFLAASSTANIFMDIWFVKGFGMGVAGVAWATFICQGISCVLAMVTLGRRLKTMKTKSKPKFFSWNILKSILRIAVPSILQQSFVSVGNILIQRVINGYGPGVIAGYAAAIKLNNLVVTSFTVLGTGLSSFVSQNLGADKPERIKPGYRAGIKMIWIITVPIVVLYLLCNRALIGFFIKEPTEEAMRTGIQFLSLVSPFYFAVGLKLMSDSVLRGAGAMRWFMIATLTDLIIRVVLAYILSPIFGVVGIWYAWPVGWIAATVISFVSYRSGIWKKVMSVI